MPITQEDVHNTADRLESAGQKVNMDSVREALGGGSYSTISPALKSWKERKRQTENIIQKMPEELAMAGRKLSAQIWEVASSLVSEEFSKQQTKDKSKIDSLTAERNEAQQEIARLEQQISDAQAALSKADEANKKQEKELNKQRTSLSAQEARVDDRNITIGKLESQAKELKNENKSLLKRCGELEGVLSAHTK